MFKVNCHAYPLGSGIPENVDSIKSTPGLRPATQKEVDSLKDYLLLHENDIATGISGMDDLWLIFKQTFGRNPEYKG